LILRLKHKSIFIQALLIFLGAAMYLLQLNSVILLMMLLLELFFLFRFRNDSPTFIFLLYTLIHLFVFIDYFWLSRQISFWSDFQNSKTLSRVLFIYYLFFVSFSFHLNRFVKVDFNLFQIQFKKNAVYFYSFILMAIAFMVFGLSGENLVQSKGYAQSLDTNKSTLFEYSILLYLLGLFFVDRKSTIQFIASMLFTLTFIARSLLYGGRIEVLEIALLNILFWLIMSNLLKWRHILFFSILGLVFFQVFGVLRENPSLLTGDDIVNKDLFVDLYSSFFSKGGLKMSTEGDVIQSSARLVGMVDEGYISFDKRIISLFSYIFSPISYFLNLGELSNLSTYNQSRFYSGGGGGIFAYLYVWLGFIGPIIGGFLLAKLFNITKSKVSIYWFIYFVAVFTTFPRWFSYNPIFFLKFCLLPVFLYWVISVFRRLFNGVKS